MQIKKELGRNIQKYRKLNNLTQEKLAEKVGVEINSISSIETGKYFPAPDNLVKLAAALNITLSELFNFSDEQTCENYLNSINNNLLLMKENKTKLYAINCYIQDLLSK